MISRISVLAGLMCSFGLAFATPVDALDNVETTLVFTEVKFKNDANNYDEYIELYNTSSEPISLAGYSLAYFNSPNPSVEQKPTIQIIGNMSLGSGEFLVLAKQTVQIPGSLKSPFNSLVDSGGILRIIDTGSDKIVDEIKWTSVSTQNSESMHRYFDDHGNPSVPGIWMISMPSPGILTVFLPPAFEDPEEEDPPIIPDPDGGMGAGLTCEGIVISEILPNPVGADGGKEFIELHNPTDEVILLNGCTLQTSANSKKYNLGATEMQPGQYIALYDSLTGLSLPNSAGGTVWLLSPTDELQAVTYAASLADDVSWIWFDGVWQPSYLITPNAPNELLPNKPCPVGQERNAETGACRNIITTADANLTPCREGQERNPATNRCRAIASSTSTLTPCREGQERNPATNRCRAVQSDTELAPCAEGQERNPETNRCRRITAVAGTTTPDVKDVYAGSLGSSPRWLLIGLLAVSAVGYALFEWRHEFLGIFKKSKA